MCARLGMVTGLGLAGVIRRRYTEVGFVGSLLIVNCGERRQHRRRSWRHG